MTRIQVFETPTRYNDFWSMKEAMKHYGMTWKRLCKTYDVRRVYVEGYWNDVDKDYLKQIAVKRFGKQQICLITD